MPSDPAFTITYWGITGTFTVPLGPAAVTNKIIQAIQHLVEAGRLTDLRPGPDLQGAIRRRVEDGLPRSLRSTFGGNTTCLEVQTADALLILDCGSGLHALSSALSSRWHTPGFAGSRAAHVLISHPHIDHTYGTPNFAPFFDPENDFTVWGSRPVLDSCDAILSPGSPFSRTYFPQTYEMMTALKNFHAIRPGDDFNIGSTRIRTYALNHPGGCLAYRLENSGRSFVFATDHEQREVPDRGLAAFAQGAALLYTDGQYLLAEYEGRQAVPGDPPMSRRGWGHSSVEACVATAVAARVRALHIGHREPRRSDEQTAELERYCQKLLRDELYQAGREPDACLALIPHEGMTVRL